MTDEVAEIISKAINRLGSWEEKTAKELAWDHPTLQQTFMRLALCFIREEAKKTSYDLRNEATVKIAQRLSAVLEYGEEHLPMV